MKAHDVLTTRFPGKEVLVLERFKLMAERNDLQGALAYMATAYSDRITKSTLADILTGNEHRNHAGKRHVLVCF
jgi:hypothetical protein